MVALAVAAREISQRSIRLRSTAAQRKNCTRHRECRACRVRTRSRLHLPNFRPILAICTTASCSMRTQALFTGSNKAEVFAEERHNVILKPIRDGASMRARIDFEAVRDSVLIEKIMELAGINAQAVLIAYVHGDGAILLQVFDVLI